MVRVISVHHFANQNVQTVEQPTACTVAPSDRLLLALTNNCVEVRDLKNQSEVLFTFPTVDEAIQIIHCLNGNYIASLETKFNRQNRETNFVRVYINWDSVATLQQSKMTSSGVSLGSSECGMVQPMRARIAGRVTPTTNQSELGNLEMIEIPVRRNPNGIACCQISGNLAILSNRVINIYKFHVKTHDISKLKFIDFEEMPILVELSFLPFEIAMCENYISAVGRDTLHMFKIKMTNNPSETKIDSNGHIENDFSFLYSSDEPINYRQLIKDETNRKKRTTVNLPSIIKENSLIHKHSPFTFIDKDLKAIIKPSSSLENKSPSYKLQDLVQLKLVPILIENAQRQVSEEFKSMILKPLYIDQNLNKNTNNVENNELKSDYRKSLNSVACMISTQQEGYLYFFGDKDTSLDRDNCIAVYPFTAPVYKIVMEDYFLHALTETGLESYTLRIGHQLCRNFDNIDNINTACPSIEDSICLVGLRPFLGVERVLLSENYLILMANSDSSPAHSVSSSGSSTASFLTLYNLELPSPKTIFNDISIVANVHRFTSSQTYCHLISEAHMVLRMALLLKKWTMTDETVKLIIERRNGIEELVDTYRISCALLGDHYIMCTNEESYILAIPYYKMARVLPLDVLKRVKKIQGQSNNQTTKGLMHYLKHTLLDIKTGADADKYFGSSSKDNFAEAMMELLENHGYADLPNLILKSRILREYSTDKLVHILEEKCSEDTNLSEKNLALTILYIQKCNTRKSEENLQKITKENLLDLLFHNWELLFEITYFVQNRNKGVTSFSELSVLLISECPELLSDLFVSLIMDKKVINLSKTIKVFLEYLPSSIGNDSNFASQVLQATLEAYFCRYFSKPENIDLAKIIYEKGATEAMKLLVRSYLSQLQMLQMKEDKHDTEGDKISQYTKLIETDPYIPPSIDETEKDRDQEKLQYNRIYKTYFIEKSKKPKGDYLFSEFRYEYLDKMPPFQIDITSKLYQVCVDNFTPTIEPHENTKAGLILKKIQALLCSRIVPKQVIVEVNGFLAVNENLRGNSSLRSITMGINDAVLLLIDCCPQCLVQFAKDRFTRGEEWKFLIATIQRRILRLSQKENLSRICFFHKKILKDLLTYAASTFTLDQLQLIFPQKISTPDTCQTDKRQGDRYQKSTSVRRDSCQSDSDDVKVSEEDLHILREVQNYEPYIRMCNSNSKANDINKMLTSKAQQLLCTLSL